MSRQAGMGWLWPELRQPSTDELRRQIEAMLEQADALDSWERERLELRLWEMERGTAEAELARMDRADALARARESARERPHERVETVWSPLLCTDSSVEYARAERDEGGG